MSLIDDIGGLIYLDRWYFDGVPPSTMDQLKSLLARHNESDVIDAIETVRVKLSIEYERIDRDKGSSQMMHEELMNCGIKLSYLRDFLKFIEKR